MHHARFDKAAHLLALTFMTLGLTGLVTPTRSAVFSIFSDQSGSCSISDDQPGTISLYVFHRRSVGETGGVVGSAFRIGTGGGFTGVLESTSHSPAFVVTGDIFQGMTVAYGSCLTDSNLLVATIVYTVFGTSEACSYLEVMPFDDGGVIETYDCDLTMEPATASTRLIVNYNTGCGPLWCVTPVQESTWGSVKALYR